MCRFGGLSFCSDLLKNCIKSLQNSSMFKPPVIKGCFPVLRFFYVRIRTECSEHVNWFIDAYWAHVRKRTCSVTSYIYKYWLLYMYVCEIDQVVGSLWTTNEKFRVWCEVKEKEVNAICSYCMSQNQFIIILKQSLKQRWYQSLVAQSFIFYTILYSTMHVDLEIVAQ